MSKKRREQVQKTVNNRLNSAAENYTIVQSSEEKSSRLADLFSRLKANWLVLLIIAVMSIGALGAGLKYLEDSAKSEMAKRESRKGNLLEKQDETFLNSINPFLPAPLPNPTPQLAKEYVYADGKLLAVEDSNANAAAPADLAVWRPSSGVWYVMAGSGSQQTIQGWGMNGDVSVQGDYDGDSKTDFSIFRPSSNTWWILKSSDGNYYPITFGASGDKVAQADYDGDGKTDLAIFRPNQSANTGTWYIQRSSDSQTYQLQFGLYDDSPAPKDYDGDGKADIGVWRSSNKTFYSLNSSNNALSTATFTQSSTIPVSADYDGDGKADYAIRNNADWIIRYSSNGQTDTISWQQSTDIEVHNDYDGDGKVDIAVWRNSNGNWYIRKSGSNGAPRQEAWGTSGDIPVPAFYRR